VARWSPDARERLERAALDLFQEQGFAATTVPEITERAGLTTRTFFRHFADKREVLFAEDVVPEVATRMVTDAPEGLAPIEVLAEGLRQVADTRFEGRREDLRVRRAITATDASLQERELRKWAVVRDSAAVALHGRGVPDTEARLLAGLGVAVLEVALADWLAAGDDSDHRPLADYVDEGLTVLRRAIAPRPGRG
jgi:AcrR family transcriptional regulator